jgi:anti-sigma regulatory factor (Ser/Thr protein kinase)
MHMTVPGTLSGDARSIAGARQMVRSMTAPCGREVADTAELLTDELVTNAVRHGGGRFSVTASIEPHRVRVAVTDRSTMTPLTVYRPGHRLDHGRGLTTVDALASNWGVERHEAEKQIWFEIDLPG